MSKWYGFRFNILKLFINAFNFEIDRLILFYSPNVLEFVDSQEFSLVAISIPGLLEMVRPSTELLKVLINHSGTKEFIIETLMNMMRERIPTNEMHAAFRLIVSIKAPA
jgi:hypothetical protein